MNSESKAPKAEVDKDVTEWLISKLAEESGDPMDEISLDKPFSEFGLDSLSLMSMSYDLETFLEREISPTVFTEFNTIRELVAWVGRPQ